MKLSPAMMDKPSGSPKFHRRQEALAGSRKSELCVGTIVAILTSYPPPNKVAQFREWRALRNS